MFSIAALALSIALAAQQPATTAPTATEQPAAADAVSQQLAPDAAAQPAADPGAAMTDASAAPPDDVAPEADDDGESTGAAVVENPYGLSALWAQGDFVARGTLLILVIMSLASWYIILTKIWDQSRLHRQFVATEKGFWVGRSLQEGINTITDSDNAFRSIAEQGLNASQQHEGRLTDRIPMRDRVVHSLQRSVDKVNNDLQGGLSFLATTGSTAPFVGLFGTVWGIYHALISIGIAGQASIDKVAGPVGEALIMTAIGLAVAVPAVLGYNWLLRRNKALFEQVRYFATDVQEHLLNDGGAAAGTASRSK